MNRPDEHARFLVAFYTPEDADGTLDFTQTGPLRRPFSCLDDEVLAQWVLLFREYRGGRTPKIVFGFADDPAPLFAAVRDTVEGRIEELLDTLTEAAVWNAYCVGPCP